jgi:4-hydroxy-tetrahydrodipicolinate reductase
MVIGTTGLGDGHQKQIEQVARSVAIVQSTNYSVGVNVLWTLVLLAGRILGERADAEIVETHHAGKVDAPSGTALTTARMIAAGRRAAPALVHGRLGKSPRKPGEIGIHAVRGGDIAGDHTVLFALPGERLELTHRAHGRETFARGALLAARFAATARPGLHAMAEVLGLETPSRA